MSSDCNVDLLFRADPVDPPPPSIIVPLDPSPLKKILRYYNSPSSYSTLQEIHLYGSSLNREMFLVDSESSSDE